MKRSHFNRRICLALVLIVPLLAACDLKPKVGPPPVSFHYRKSQIPTRGLVAGIQNTSTKETLSEFVVTVTSKDGKGSRSHRVGKVLEPQDSITIGWIELDGWTLSADDKLTLTCEQYAEAATSIVKAP